MTCPYYIGNREDGNCDLKSEYYKLTKKAITDLCNANYPACAIYLLELKINGKRNSVGVEKLTDSNHISHKIYPSDSADENSFMGGEREGGD